MKLSDIINEELIKRLHALTQKVVDKLNKSDNENTATKAILMTPTSKSVTQDGLDSIRKFGFKFKNMCTHQILQYNWHSTQYVGE